MSGLEFFGGVKSCGTEEILAADKGCSWMQVVKRARRTGEVTSFLSSA